MKHVQDLIYWISCSRYKLLLCFLILGHYISAQHSSFLRKDEIIQLGKQVDTAYIMLLLKEGEQLQLTSPDSAMLLSERAWTLCHHVYNPKLSALALARIGGLYYLKGNYKQAIIFLKDAADTALKYGSYQFLLNTYNNIGIAYSENGNFGLSSLYHYKVLKFAQRKKLANRRFIAEAYSCLALNWLYLGEWKRCLNYLDSTQAMALLLKDTSLLGYVSLYRGTTYYENNINLQYAEEYLLKALNYGKKGPDFALQQNALVYLAAASIEQAKIKEAFSYLKQAEKINHKILNINVRLLPQLYLSHVFYFKKLYVEAEKTILPVISKATDKSTLLASYLWMSNISVARGNYQQAYNFEKKHRILQDSLIHYEKEKTVEMLVEYLTFEKDKKIAQNKLIIFQQQSRIKQIYIGIGAFAFSGLLLTAFVIVLLRGNKRKQQIALLNLRQGQFKALLQGEQQERKRIARELHDGIGSLISAAKLHLRSEDQTAHNPTYANGMNLLDEAYKELRMTAHSLVSEQLLSDGIVKAVAAYCNRISHPTLFLVNLLHSGEEPMLPPEQSLSLYRIIQELVQNALKHGKAQRVTVQINYHEKHLYISVEDNGIGFPVVPEGDSEGIGLINLKERVALLGGHMEIDNRPGMGMTVYLEMFMMEDK